MKLEMPVISKYAAKKIAQQSSSNPATSVTVVAPLVQKATTPQPGAVATPTEGASSALLKVAAAFNKAIERFPVSDGTTLGELRIAVEEERLFGVFRDPDTFFNLLAQAIVLSEFSFNGGQAIELLLPKEVCPEIRSSFTNLNNLSNEALRNVRLMRGKHGKLRYFSTNTPSFALEEPVITVLLDKTGDLKGWRGGYDVISRKAEIWVQALG